MPAVLCRSMDKPLDILCIGSVLWDVIGRTDRPMALGHDVPGRIRRVPGGVAMNVAAACLRAGLKPTVLTSLGRDEAGRALAEACSAMGLVCDHIAWSDVWPTDCYMAIEAPSGLIAAIADAHSLERAGRSILAPLWDGRLGAPDRPFSGHIALDGNLAEWLLAEIAVSPLFAAADLRIAPASPSKAERLLPLLGHGRATLYLNRIEAQVIAGRGLASAEEAAATLRSLGARRVLVTDGAAPVAEASPDGIRLATPPPVTVVRVTGAGDTFMAAHIAAEARGAKPQTALQMALDATAAYVSADGP